MQSKLLKVKGIVGLGGKIGHGNGAKIALRERADYEDFMPGVLSEEWKEIDAWIR